MSDPSTPTRSLSEIGHLFLSSVRDRQTNGAAMPRRQPPGRSNLATPLSVPMPPRLDVAIDVPEVAVAADEIVDRPSFAPLHAEEQLSFPSITAVVAGHLSGRQFDCARHYARHLADHGQRIGLIEVDIKEFRLSRFDPPTDELAMDADGEDVESTDARSLGDALEELSWDLDRWLIVLPPLRSAEARSLLTKVNHWTLLSTCDHDGIISCYRTLKGLQESHRPRLTLALLDAPSDREAEKIHHKLASVCQQFLEWPLEGESPVKAAPSTMGHLVARSAVTDPALPCEQSTQWQVVAAFLDKANAPASATAPVTTAAPVAAEPKVELEPLEAIAPELEVSEPMTRIPTVPPIAAPIFREVPAEPIAQPAAQPSMRWAGEDSGDAISEVIELPEASSTSASVLSAILRNESANLFECPVTPPMCPDARLAVTRDRRIVLLAAARQGLGELRSIARAYNWLIENYKLICMAVPQLAINPTAQPCLRLLIDHADLTAEILQPMLQSSTVTVQAYRRLKWGGKTGLLLEAA